MHRKEHLPQRAIEDGVELFSSTGDLDLIRTWLASSPTDHKIVRVSHRCNERGDHSFTVSTPFGSSKRCADRHELQRALNRWHRHLQTLDLPGTAWVGTTTIELRWYPAGLEPRMLDEVPIAERVDFDFEFAREKAASLWLVLHGTSPAALEQFQGDLKEYLYTIAKLGPGEELTEGFQLSQEELEESIIDDPDTWVLFLLTAVAAGHDLPILRDFQSTFARLEQDGVPDLSQFAAAWDCGRADSPPAQTENDNYNATELLSLVSSALDSLLSPRLDEVNALLSDMFERLG